MELCGISSVKAHIEFMWLHPHDLSTSQRPHLLVVSHRMLGFPSMNFEHSNHSIHICIPGCDKNVSRHFQIPLGDKIAPSLELLI